MDEAELQRPLKKESSLFLLGLRARVFEEGLECVVDVWAAHALSAASNLVLTEAPIDMSPPFLSPFFPCLRAKP